MISYLIKKFFQKAIRGEGNFTIDKNINWILNSGNFIVNKSKFIKIMKKDLIVKKDIKWMQWQYLFSGLKLTVKLRL